MRLLQLSEFRQRVQAVAIAIGTVLATGIGYSAYNTVPVYVESATVLFTTAGATSADVAYALPLPSLITTGAIASHLVMDPATARLISAAGGTASYNLALINFYNEDYPSYDYPEATLTASSTSALAAHKTFVIATRTLNQVLQRIQAQRRVAVAARIVIRLIGASGPIATVGSHKRVLAGLLLLFMIIGSAIWRTVNQRFPVAGPGRHALQPEPAAS